MLTHIFTTKWSMPSINKEVFSLKEGENHGFFNWFLKGPLLIISQADLWHVTDPPIRKIYSVSIISNSKLCWFWKIC